MKEEDKYQRELKHVVPRNSDSEYLPPTKVILKSPLGGIRGAGLVELSVQFLGPEVAPLRVLGRQMVTVALTSISHLLWLPTFR